jgi:hypothetical protein
MAKTPSAKKATKLARKATAKPVRKAAAKGSKVPKPSKASKASKASRGSKATSRATSKAAAKGASKSSAKGVAPKAAAKPGRGVKPAPKGAKAAQVAKVASNPVVKNATLQTARKTSSPAAATHSAVHSAVQSVAKSAPHNSPLSDPNLNRALAAAIREDKSGLGKYVYCIVRATMPLSFGPIGIGGEPADVYTVNWRDLAAVISDSPPGVQDPTRENVLAHQRVNETVMMEHTVLPMSFGTVFKTREDIIEFLRSAHEAFADVLNKMENKLEFGLKVLWDRDAVLLELEQDDEDIRRLKSEIASQKGSTYFARMQYGRLVDAALQARSERYVAEIFDGLRDVAVAARSNKPIGDRMIMNAAFLVSRPEEPAFDARVKALGARYDKLTFKYTGPWPPYNFVNIRLKLERA